MQENLNKEKKNNSKTQLTLRMARRHSMSSKDKKDKGETIATTLKKQEDKIKFVQYRVKDEIFRLPDYYQPVKILSSKRSAYSVVYVCEAIDTRNGSKIAIKKTKGVFDHITDARRILREIKLLMHFDHQDVSRVLCVTTQKKLQQCMAVCFQACRFLLLLLFFCWLNLHLSIDNRFD